MRIICIYMIFFCSSVLLFGQDSLHTVQKNTIVKVDLISPTWWLTNKYWKNMFSISVEHSMFKNQSLQLTGYFNDYTYTHSSKYIITPTSTIYSPSTIQMTKTIQIYFQYRFYLALKHKFYISPYIKYSYMHKHSLSTYTNSNPETDEYEFIQQDLGIGALAGYQFFIKKRISVDVSLGMGVTKHINTKNIIVEEYFDPDADQSFFPEGFIALNLGYRFVHK